ncbi:MAG: methyltransferase domain-containing protein [Epsilonproteobacteria bacterium]|nr:hypothetical protein [Campylobacterota bacterium]NPA57337.1 methyltransferase domain-containing protein [Campylobacterota bacterium]
MEPCLEQIAHLIYERVGVTFEGKWHLLDSRLSTACQELKIGSCDEFYRRLLEPNSFHDLLSYFMISQSYFYREAKHFEILLRLIGEEGIERPRILSLPCANGEEPYSIATTLEHRGIEGYRIEAIDINPKAIKRARCGCYPPHQMVHIPPQILARYFHFDGKWYWVDQRLKRRIHFQVGNLFELEGRQYDFIFCRNLMIYLDPPKRREAMEIFSKLLKEGGYLFLSFSDYVGEVEGFDRISYENKEIYRKRGRADRGRYCGHRPYREVHRALRKTGIGTLSSP